MGASDIRAGRAYVALGTDDIALNAGLKSAAAKVQQFGQVVRNVGLGMSVVAAAITAPLTALAYKVAAVGQQLLLASQRSGMTIESLSELQYAATQTGTDFETLESGVSKMGKFLYTAAKGSHEALEALDTLGLKVEDIAAMRPEQRFEAFADALMRVKDAAIQNGLAAQVFGKNIGYKLLPMLQGGAAGLKQWRDRARELNLTQSAEGVTAAAAFNDALGDMNATIARAGTAIGATLIPILKKNAELVTKIAAAAVPWITANRQIFATVFRVATIVGIAGSGLAVFGTVMDAAGKGLSVFGSVLGYAAMGVSSLISPLGLLAVGAVALGGYLIYASGQGARALNYLRGLFTDLKDDGTAAFKGISDALSGAKWGTAARIAWNALQIEWQRGVLMLKAVWGSGLTPIIGAWNDLLSTVDAMTTPWLAALGTSWGQIGDGIASAFRSGMRFAAYAFAFIETLATNWRDAVRLAVVTVELAFVRMWESVKTTAGGIFSDMVGGMKNMFYSAVGGISNMFSSMLDGISNMVSSWMQRVANHVVNAALRIKETLASMASGNFTFRDIALGAIGSEADAARAAVMQSIRDLSDPNKKMDPHLQAIGNWLSNNFHDSWNAGWDGKGSGYLINRFGKIGEEPDLNTVIDGLAKSLTVEMGASKQKPKSSLETQLEAEQARLTGSLKSSIDAKLQENQAAIDAMIARVTKAAKDIEAGFADANIGADAKGKLDALKREREELLKQAEAANKPGALRPAFTPNGFDPDAFNLGGGVKSSVIGSFNPFAFPGAIGGSDAKKVADNTKRTNELLQKLIDQKPGGIFT